MLSALHSSPKGVQSAPSTTKTSDSASALGLVRPDTRRSLGGPYSRTQQRQYRVNASV